MLDALPSQWQGKGPAVTRCKVASICLDSEELEFPPMPGPAYGTSVVG